MLPKNDEEILELAFFQQKEILDSLKSKGEYIFPKENKKVYKKWEKGLLRSDNKKGFPTPSGKIELWSSLLEKYGYDPLPVYTGGKESKEGSPDLFEKYPLVLNTGARIQSTFRSQHLNIPSLVKHQPKAEFLIHPEDAKARDIGQGDLCYLFNDRGRIKMTACVTKRAQKGDLEVNMGGGGPLQSKGWREADVNKLTGEAHQDPISGFPVFKRMLCEVEKVKNG